MMQKSVIKCKVYHCPSCKCKMQACIWSRVNSKEVDDKRIFFSAFWYCRKRCWNLTYLPRSNQWSDVTRAKMLVYGELSIRCLNWHQIQNNLWSRTWDAQCMCTITGLPTLSITISTHNLGRTDLLENLKQSPLKLLEHHIIMVSRGLRGPLILPPLCRESLLG